MADVACFCGCLYSFDGGSGACPRCDQVATVTTAATAASAERSPERQPAAARTVTTRTPASLQLSVVALRPWLTAQLP
jgi:hypothetical protein